MHQRLQMEIDDLKMQKQISTQAHEADTQVCFTLNNLFFHRFHIFRLLKFIMIIFYMISLQIFVLMVMEKMFLHKCSMKFVKNIK
jgi:hypothetical protein